jgi:predicted Zn finger-like uncharacterized protein
MIIICEECAKAYNLDDSMIDENGSAVRCTNCRHEFTVHPHDETQGAGSERETAGDAAPEADGDSLGLLETDPLPVEFDAEDDLINDWQASADRGEGFDTEAAPELEEAEPVPATEDEPEDFADGVLPAIEDMEGFDEALLAEDDELPTDGPFDSDAELLPGEDMTEAAETDTDDPQEDILDLSDIEDLVASGDFQGAADQEPSPAASEPILQLEEDGDLEEPGISDLEGMPVDDETPALEEPLLEEDEDPECNGLLPLQANEEGLEPAEDILVEHEDPEIEPEIEIFFETVDEPAGGETPCDPVLAGNEEPEIWFEEQPSAEEAVPEILFEKPAPVGFDGGGFRHGDGASASDTTDPEKTTVLDGGATQVIDSPPPKSPAPEPAHGRRRRKPVMAAAAALIVVAAITLTGRLAGLRLADVSGIIAKIPFAGDFFAPEKTDPAGNLRILPLEETVRGVFVHNSSTGKLFVIRGRVRNTYNHPRSHIKVIGRLYQKGNRLLKTARVYCGNTLSDAELEAMDMGAINRRLGNHRGDGRSNMHVASGGSVPFMIVFNHPPDNLDEYSIQVDSSSG